MESFLYLMILLTIVKGQSEETIPTTPTIFTSTEKAKFGLAWLFSYNNKMKVVKVQEEQEDERATDTSLFLTASKDTTRVEVFQTLQNYRKEVETCEFGDSIVKMEAREGDDVHLNCKLQNLNYQLELNKLEVTWNWIEKSNCNNTNTVTVVGSNKQPDCMIFTNFPFYDLQTSSKNISCSLDWVIPKVTVNDTGKYRCRAVFGFPDTDVLYYLSGEFHLRISRRDDYSIHKVTSILIGITVVILCFAVLFKKIFKIKLPWEKKYDNYMPEWPQNIPARRIASSGSLGPIRRTSHPGIVEEEEEEEGKEVDTKNIEVIVQDKDRVKPSLKRVPRRRCSNEYGAILF